MKRIFALALCMIASISLCLRQAKASDSTETHGLYDKEIGGVIEIFKTSIIAKNKDALAGLSLNGSTPCIGVWDTDPLLTARAKNPKRMKASIGNYASFVDSIVSAKEQDEERFSNVVIHADGTIANVYFDYTFSVNGKITNYGHETWSLINADDGWKITSIIWSIVVTPHKA